MKLQTITARELREILFYLDDQDVTVNELRELLFHVEDQDKQVQIGFSLFTKMGLPESSNTVPTHCP